MRAEMTVGLDLESLENLRIYNGYSDFKRERKLSLELPSSPEENGGATESDTSQYDNGIGTRPKTKLKCGRPNNPIPRHKRDSHIKAEYKRRDKIQKGFDTLLATVPSLIESSSGRESRSVMLYKTAEYCRQLKTECGGAQKEIEVLRQELETLGTEIQTLQDQLPQHGVKRDIDVMNDVTMDALYDQYVTEETKKSWKFWIFGFFMRPLYDSYKRTMENRKTKQEVNSIFLEWIQNTLSLKSLRKGFLDSLRYISKHTTIMTSPEQLEQEAQSNLHRHFLCDRSKLPWPVTMAASEPVSPSGPPATRAPTPKPGPSQGYSSRVTTPVSVTPYGVTPLQTPNPTPPRTPVSSRRSVKRENDKVRESRSRSNSPATEEAKSKRRSSYRSRSGRRTPSDSQKDHENPMEYMTSPPVSRVINPFSNYIVQTVQSSQPMERKDGEYLAGQSGTSFSTPLQQQQQNTLMEQHVDSNQGDLQGATSVNNKNLVDQFVESLISALGPHSNLPKFDKLTQPSSTSNSSLVIPSVITKQSPITLQVQDNHATHVLTQPNMVNFPLEMHSSSKTSSAFVAANKLENFSHNTVSSMFEEPNSSEFHADIFQNFVSMETTSCQMHMTDSHISMPSFNDDFETSMVVSVGNNHFGDSNSQFRTPLQTASFTCCTTPLSVVAATSGSVPSAGVSGGVSSDFLIEDDSLMTLLKVDLLDMNSVMTFFKNDDNKS
ncbi:uncharacterized protein LOC127852901 [Dreissena polymorpha]|uniref:BHLH domain-containing protein n=1 Tax=Dreissena polymorpha TaxID=45954 RepID=A0A9D4HQG6_DREPO|nr:uncharacterized protein LOC127852901 [Dreissena polymorpha]KAH3727286.1 hypothetical protein DPMN_053216 [Dreissena polymorpha]